MELQNNGKVDAQLCKNRAFGLQCVFGDEDMFLFWDPDQDVRYSRIDVS